VPAASLPDYGLAPQPFRQYVLKAAVPGASTNLVLAQLDFGTNQNTLYARVPGESFVYSMDRSVLDMLPTASWQMRDRRVWNFTATDVARVTVQKGNRTRELLRKAERNWTLGAGSQGIMDEVTSAQIEETIHRLGDLTANFWVQRGESNLDAYGFKDIAFKVTIELTSGEKRMIEFGKEAPSKFPFAAVMLDGETWVMEFPWATFQFVEMYLTPPGNLP
jgi:hypothetical protein